MNFTEQQTKELLERVQKNRKGLMHIKEAAASCQMYELASNLRDIERENWPETDEQKEAKERARILNLLFRMVDLNVDHRTCYLISETLKAHDSKGGEFSIQDAAKIQAKAEEIFISNSEL